MRWLSSGGGPRGRGRGLTVLLVLSAALVLSACGNRGLVVRSVHRFVDLPSGADPQLAVRCSCARTPEWVPVQSGQEALFAVRGDVVPQLLAWETVCYLAHRFRDAGGEWHADSVLVDVSAGSGDEIRIVNDLYYIPLSRPAAPETTDREGEEAGPDRPVK
ncbi:MAG: hypothetical protein KBD56_01530 [Candidatus Eisenbacteria bacterium]|nr:hypothetical protein [Candidatus Eisenbacteria bacterium]